MKKLILGLMALLVLSSCKKSGSVEVVVNDDIRSMEAGEFRPIDETAKDEVRASYDVFSVVPGTYKIEYYQDEYTKIAYNVKLTLKLHLNHSLRLTESFYNYVSKMYYRGEDVHSLPLGELFRKCSIYKINLNVIALDADGKNVNYIRFDSLIPVYCDYNQKEALENDACQELYDFVTSPAGTEKEITLYYGGSNDFPNDAKNITDIYLYTNIGRCLEKEKLSGYAMWLYND